MPEAIKLYEKAALLGNNNAAYNLGSLLLSRDEHTTAARWSCALRRARRSC